jgi:hypothetical protein
MLGKLRMRMLRMGSNRRSVATYCAHLISLQASPVTYEPVMGTADERRKIAELAATLILALVNDDYAGFVALWDTLSEDQEVGVCMDLAGI